MATPLRSATGSGRDLAAASLGVVAPIGVVYLALVASSAIMRPLSETESVLHVLVLLCMSAALCLAPLAVWPFRLQGYVAWAGGGLAALGFFNLLHVVEYSELVTLGAIDAVVSTSAREAGEFLGGRFVGLGVAVVGTVLSVGAIGGAMGRIHREARVPTRARLAYGALGLLAVGVLAAHPFRLFPVSTVKNAVDYVDYRARFQDAQKARESHRFDAVATVAWESPPVFVLVIGETLRRRQMGVYGYERDTTPRLGALDSLFVFSDVTTTSSVTQPSVKMMMTEATPRTAVDHGGRSWLWLARELGYQTAWISNQDRTEGTETALIAEDAARVLYTSHSYTASAQLDEDVLAPLADVLAQRSGPLAIVVHLMGSHEDYSLRYPARFERWSGAAQPELALIDHYDNSVAYTDWVVAEIIERVGETGAPALVTFVADHGENLFEAPHRLRGHGAPVSTMAEVEVPLLVWLSDAFREARPTVAAALAETRHQPVSTQDIFYGFADLLGAEWPDARPERSVFRASFEAIPRHVLTPTGTVVRVDDLDEHLAWR